MPVQGPKVPIPDTDLVSYLLDGIPNESESPIFSRPFLYPLTPTTPPQTSFSLLSLKHYALILAKSLTHLPNFHQRIRICLISPNLPTCTLLTLSVIAAGGVFCAAQPDLKVREYVDQFRREKPELVFVWNDQKSGKELLETVEKAWREVGGEAERIWSFGGRVDERRSVRRFWTELLLDVTEEDGHAGGRLSWQRLSTEKECNATPCLLFTTSGTSGLRKTAVFSHRRVVAAYAGITHRSISDAMLYSRSLPKIERSKPVSTRRLLHTISVSRAMGTLLPLGLIRTRQSLDMECWFLEWSGGDMEKHLRRLQEVGITAVNCAPFTAVRMFGLGHRPVQVSKQGEEEKYDFSSVTSVTVTGAPSALSTLKSVRENLIKHGASRERLRIERALGITEAGSLVAHSWASDPPIWDIEPEEGRRGAYQGRLEPNFEAVVMEEGGGGKTIGAVDITGTGRPGELWIRGPTVVSEYWGNDEATKEAFSVGNGWLHTGDVGFLDGDRLWIVDRMKVGLRLIFIAPKNHL